MKVCYFGIYKPELSRNRIYISGLRKNGVEVIECRDDGGKIAKYINLWKKHKKIKGDYDAMIVGYPGHVLVPFAKLLSKKPVIADLLGSFKDAEEHSHKAGLFRRLKDSLIDFLAVKFADCILLESEAQKDFFVKKFGDNKKFRVLYTGLDEETFYCSEKKRSANKKIVLFRGRLTPESGIFHILKATELLKSRTDISFRIIGFHYLLGDKVKKAISDGELSSVELISDYLSDEDLRGKMCDASLSLGQFESSPRLDRTIPHKIFESMYMGLPIVTADSPAVRELLENNVSCLFVNRADPEDMAKKVIRVIDDPTLADRLVINARKAYDERASSKVITDRLIDIIKTSI